MNELYESIGKERVEGGDVKISQQKDTPLAVVLGVGGTQALQSVLVDTILTPGQKVNILVNLFGVEQEIAEQMLNTNI